MIFFIANSIWRATTRKILPGNLQPAGRALPRGPGRRTQPGLFSRNRNQLSSSLNGRSLFSAARYTVADFSMMFTPEKTTTSPSLGTNEMDC